MATNRSIKAHSIEMKFDCSVSNSAIAKVGTSKSQVEPIFFTAYC